MSAATIPVAQMACERFVPPPDPERMKGCLRCAKLPEAHRGPAVVHLGPCTMCGEGFKVDLQWWVARRRLGLPELEQCANCHAFAHRGAPPVT